MKVLEPGNALIITLFILSCLIKGCVSTKDKNNPDAENLGSTNPKVILNINSPAENAAKRILRVETFNSASCFYDRNLTTNHPEYQGILVYQENDNNTDIKEKRQIAVNRPITIKATLSKIFNSDKSDICYFQPVSFTPLANKSYELYLSSFCEIIIYETNVNETEIKNTNPQSKPASTEVRMIDIYTENKHC